MTDVDPQSILGSPPKQIDPLTQLKSWREYTNAGIQGANALEQNAQIRQQTQNLQQENQKGRVELGKAGMSFMSGYIFSQANQGLDQQTPEAYEKIFELGRKVFGGEHHPVIDTLKQQFDTLKTPEERKRWAFGVGGAMSPPNVQQQTYGQVNPSTTPSGQTQYVFTPQPNSPVPAQNVGPPVGGGMSPDTGNQPAYVKTDRGLKSMTAREVPAYLARNGGTQVDQNGQPLQTGVQPPATPRPPVGGGRPTGAPGIGNIGTPGQPPKAAVPPPNNDVATDKQLDAAQKSKDEANAASGELSSFAVTDRNASLNTILTASPEALGNMGKGTELYRNGQQMLTNLWPGMAKTLNISPETMTNTQELVKAFARVAQSAGSKSDYTALMALSAGPNPEMSGATLVRVAGYIMGLNLQEAVLTDHAYKKSEHLPLKQETFYGPTRTRIQKDIDPNVFQHVYRDRKDADEYYRKLNKSGRDRYDHTVDMLNESGMIPQTKMQ